MGFHLSIPMGNVESVPIFFPYTETVKDRVKNTMQLHREDPAQPLESLADPPPPLKHTKHKKTSFSRQTKVETDCCRKQGNRTSTILITPSTRRILTRRL